MEQIIRLKEIKQQVQLTEQDVRFMHKFEDQIRCTTKKYKLLSMNEKVLIAVSGGKDSTVILHVLKKLGYNVAAVTVDAKIGCYTEKNLVNLREVCDKLDVKLHVISFLEEFGSSLCYLISLLESKGHDIKSCSVCGVLRRQLLNKKAKELKVDKLVTGHNRNDEAQVVMMNLFRGNVELLSRLGPKTGLTDNENFVQRVKPMYFTSEEDVVRYSKLCKFPVHYGKCPCSVTSYRYSVREVFDELVQLDCGVEENIINNFMGLSGKLKNSFKSIDGVNICKCGEPCKNEVCQGCAIMGLINA